MSLDPKVEEAIRTAVQKAGQNESLSRGLIAWFDSVSSSNEKLTDKDSTSRRLEHLYDDTILPPDDEGTETDIDPGTEEDAGSGDAGIPDDGRSGG